MVLLVEQNAILTRSRMHLNGASACLPALVRAATQAMTMSLKGSESLQCSQDAFKSIYMFEDHSTINFHLGHFVAFDILACISTRSTLFLNLDHKDILRRDALGIDLRTIIGCENWVMQILFDIAKLDTWKRNAQKAKKLSIVELANHGSQIDLQLQSKFAELRAPSSSNSSIEPLASSQVHLEITEIFALSAMTYLHVVLSGAYPELPEIIESVEKTIQALREMSDKKAFPRLSWCFCITGCLALEPQHRYFREIFEAAELDEWSAGTCIQALETMEECWQIRKSSSSCDWVSAMDKRGQYSLLF